MWRQIKCFVALAACLALTKARAQDQEVQQLLLNVQKLAQLKALLSDLKKGYQILNGGYQTIRNISKGTFQLHDTYLSSLMEISPAVRNYSRVKDIITMQLSILKEYKAALQRSRTSNLLQPSEVKYLTGVYTGLFKQSLNDLTQLLSILTAGELRMSDGDRLEAIDDIWRSMQEKLAFSRAFGNQTKLLVLQRSKEKRNNEKLTELYSIKP